MHEFKLSINGKCHTAKKPTVGNLKDFLKFQSKFDIKDGFDIDALQVLEALLTSILPSLTQDALEDMDVDVFIKAAGDIALWMSGAMDTGETLKN